MRWPGKLLKECFISWGEVNTGRSPHRRLSPLSLVSMCNVPDLTGWKKKREENIRAQVDQHNRAPNSGLERNKHKTQKAAKKEKKKKHGLVFCVLALISKRTCKEGKKPQQSPPGPRGRRSGSSTSAEDHTSCQSAHLQEQDTYQCFCWVLPARAECRSRCLGRPSHSHSPVL